MKIAFLTYPAAFQNIGGGEVLLTKLCEYLLKEGEQVDLFDSWNAKIEDYDWLHVFGAVKDCLGLVETAKKRGVRVAITPLQWSDLTRALHNTEGLKTRLDFTMRHLVKVLFPAFPSARRRLMLSSDLVFPNSPLELDQIARLFAIPKEKMRVVYNGVDESFLGGEASAFKKEYSVDYPFILGVGRIEPRKNQLSLIRAVKNLKNQKLILIGSPVTGYEDYAAQCRREGESFTRFIPSLKHGSDLLKSAYTACSLFVLQGWFETPGLVALEAALAGAPIVVTKGGSTKDYFKNLVDYIDPANPGQIACVIEKNLGKSQNPALKKHILENFTWPRIAQETIKYYREFSRC